ncbi:hypothetical protein OIU78_027993 [Salix suchowensis]|nr:hypothetical protein OIU78_027993 [Salix suchowensis]
MGRRRNCLLNTFRHPLQFLGFLFLLNIFNKSIYLIVMAKF